MKYYGLISGLPSLSPLASPQLEVADLRSLLPQYAEQADQDLFEHFFFQIDLINFNSLIQEKGIWLEGGNLSQEEVKTWVEKRQIEHHWLKTDNPSQDAISALQLHWQAFYNRFFSLSDESLNALIRFEITLKNFYKGYLERNVNQKAGEYFLDGGDFDRFAYNKLLIGDIQAEHAHLAHVLSAFEVQDPFEREQRVLEAKWDYYGTQSFFDAFGTTAVICWLLKYLDLHKWEMNDAERGQQNMLDFTNRLINTTELEAL